MKGNNLPVALNVSEAAYYLSVIASTSEAIYTHTCVVASEGKAVYHLPAMRSNPL